MLAWISANIGTIIICAVLLIIVAAIINGLLPQQRQKRQMISAGGRQSPSPSKFPDELANANYSNGDRHGYRSAGRKNDRGIFDGDS